jgi:hypothetical protein
MTIWYLLRSFVIFFQEKSGNPGPNWAALFSPGANLTIASYNASAVKNCNATCSLVRLEKKIICPNNVLAYYSAVVVVVNFKVVGLGPGVGSTFARHTKNLPATKKVSSSYQNCPNNLTFEK